LTVRPGSAASGIAPPLYRLVGGRIATYACSAQALNHISQGI